MRESLVAELEKRLDLDIDTFLDSPKLRLKLSPAELDKSLLEFYDSVSNSPGGDILRAIGGGGSIGLQNLYMRRHAERERWRKMKEGVALDIFSSPFFDDDSAENKGETVTQLIRRSLRKNLPMLGSQSSHRVEETEKSTDPSEKTPSMCYGTGSSPSGMRTWSGLRPTATFPKMPSRRSSNKFSILI
jgi:hypothetical protein